MNLVIEAEKVPLEVDSEGVVRVGGTRVTLETVVTAFQRGATAEEIVQQYSALDLADVYAVIGFYLRRKNELDEYLRQRLARSEAVQRAHEDEHDPAGIRERLLARRAAKT